MIIIHTRYLLSVKRGDIFYNILRRELDNFLLKTPLFWTFRDSIFQVMINYIDPYVNAFINGDTLNIYMGADFAAKELNSKIQEFKKEYKEKINENKTDF